jgi:hypothetical protein
MNPEGSARRVMFFHSLLFKRPPIVVIGVSERRRDDRYADLAPAVAELTEEYGLRVIVEGPPNSIPPNLDGMVMVVEPMTLVQLESIPELNGLMALLQCHRLDDAVWQVLGGSPLCYEALKMDLFLSKAASDDDVVTEVKHHIRSTLARALSQTHFRSPHTEQALQFFREKKLPKMTNAAFVEMGFTLIPSDRVFREVMIKNDDMYIVPYSPAMSLVITHGIRDGPGLSALSDQLFHAAGEDTSTL